jgi:hypothetical protein
VGNIRKTIGAVIIVGALGASAFLTLDALVFALTSADPVTGRVRGCYTFLDDVAGVLEPSRSLRCSQLVAGLLGLLATFGYVGWALGRRVFRPVTASRPRPKRSRFLRSSSFR